jgi:hypothetical protein
VSKHTPGPWEVWEGPEYVGGGRDLCIGAGEKWLFNMDHRNCVARDHHWGLCNPAVSTDIASTGGICDECCTGKPFGSPCPHSDVITAEQRANARLIAAAPELREALVQVVKAYETFISAGFSRGTFNRHVLPALRGANAAIAKAEGRDG